MDLARLKALRELAARRSISGAAQALNLTPSAVSQQIAHLEQALDMPLTQRHGRGVKLTYAGEVLAGHAERIMTALDEARSEMALIRQQISGDLRIAAFATAAAALLPEVLQAMRAVHPRLQITVLEMEPAEGLQALGSRDAELAIVDDLSVRLARMERQLQQVPIVDDELQVVMAHGHRLAGRPAIGLAELKDEQWALDSASSFYGDFVVELCRQAGYSPRVNAACRGAEIIEAMVASGCSVSIIPGLRLRQMGPRLLARPLRPAVRRRISVAFRQGDSAHPAIQAVVAQLAGLEPECLR